MMKKVGIITFHNSYNCGSMLESYAMQTAIEKIGKSAEIINFSNLGQRELYSEMYKNNSFKNIIKNIIIFPHRGRIKYNNSKYEEFKNKYFKLTKDYDNINELDDSSYSTVVSGSDQIWNVTIADADDAYFLPWVKKAKKVAYAPSFGSKNILKYSNNPDKYKKYILNYDAVSIRENNGKKWLKDLCNIDVDVLLDPTLLLEKKDYECLEASDFEFHDDYIFFYSPGFDRKICKFVKQIADKYNLKVITWSAKQYYTKMIKSFGFELSKYENPSMYLSLIKNSKLIMTTSYHGTIFSTIYKKNFIVIKNGGMYGDDDRVKTLLNQLCMESRLIPYNFDDNFNYMENVDYTNYDNKIKLLREKSLNFLEENVK